MKHKPYPHRPAVAALFASVAFLNAPVFAQTTVQPPVVNVAPPPPAAATPPTTVNAPPPTVTPPPGAAAPAPPTPTMAPVVHREPSPAEAEAARTPTRETRRAEPARRPASAETRAAPPEAAPAADATTPALTPAPAPVAEAPRPAPPPAFAPAEPAVPPTEAAPQGRLLWAWIIGAAVLAILIIGLFAARRRRRHEEIYEEPYVEEPDVAPPVVPAADPAFARAAPVVADPEIAAEPVPVVPVAEPVGEAVPDADGVTVEGAHSADVEALAATSAPPSGRPWLELMLRPLRAGTSRDDAIVQFELTVGNTGSAPANDVRVATWMVAGAAGTEMERMLIEPPADAGVSMVDIPSGDGTRIEAEIAMPKAGLSDPVLPIVIADARYRLSDGTEGRTRASFAIGLPDDGDLAPFPVDRASGLFESVEARLHGEPERI